MNRKFPFNHAFEEALAAKKNKRLEAWVQEYLLKEGNQGLASALQTNKTIMVDIREITLSVLNKIDGPEPVRVRETLDTWEERVSGLSMMIAKGYKPPPLIVTDFWKPLEIVDGNHRHEALKRNGITKYWTIFFIKNESTKQLLAKYI